MDRAVTKVMNVEMAIIISVCPVNFKSVNHYFALGGFVATYKFLRELQPTKCGEKALHPRYSTCCG